MSTEKTAQSLSVKPGTQRGGTTAREAPRALREAARGSGFGQGRCAFELSLSSVSLTEGERRPLLQGVSPSPYGRAPLSPVAQDRQPLHHSTSTPRGTGAAWPPEK